MSRNEKRKFFGKIITIYGGTFYFHESERYHLFLQACMVIGQVANTSDVPDHGYLYRIVNLFNGYSI